MTGAGKTVPVTALYRRDEAIGRGNFGVVYRGTNLQTKQIVAIKVLNLDTVEDEVKDVQHEITMLSQLSQSDAANITKYYGSYLHGTRLWIIMDFCAGGSVRLLLKAGVIEERYTAVIMRELLHALIYIHREGVIHRDIKAANILITKDGRVRLCDFGVAAKVSSTKVKRSTIVGTPYWMAPEVITEGALYNSKADVWSLGVTVYEMTTGNPPYSDQEAFRAIMLIPKQKPARLEGPQYSTALKEFVAQCLDEHPNERPSAEDLTKLKLIRNTKNVPTTILRDLILRYKKWKEHHGSNVRDSVAIFNQQKPLEFDDEEAELESNSDTLWDFDIDPSNNSLPMPPSIDASGSLSPADGGPDSLDFSDGPHIASGTTSEANSRGGTIVGSMAPTIHKSIGTMEDIQPNGAFQPVDMLRDEDVATAPLAAHSGIAESNLGYSATARVASPLDEAPQSLMELFGVSQDNNLGNSQSQLHSPVSATPGLTGINVGQQPSTPTVEIEIPTFESLSATTNTVGSSFVNTNKPVPPVPTSQTILSPNSSSQTIPVSAVSPTQHQYPISTPSSSLSSRPPLPLQSQSHPNLLHTHQTHHGQRPTLTTTGLPSTPSQPNSAGVGSLPTTSGLPGGPNAPPNVPPPALPSAALTSGKRAASRSISSGSSSHNSSAVSLPSSNIPPVPPIPSATALSSQDSPPLVPSPFIDGGSKSFERSSSPLRTTFRAPSVGSPPVSPHKDSNDLGEKTLIKDDVAREPAYDSKEHHKPSPLGGRSRNNSLAGTGPTNLDVSMLSNTPSPLSSPSTLTSQTFSRGGVTSTPRNLSQRKVGGKMRIALPVGPLSRQPQLSATHSPLHFPPLPQLDISVLLDSTPKEAVVSQLNLLLDVFTSGLDQVRASLDKLPA